MRSYTGWLLKQEIYIGKGSMISLIEVPLFKNKRNYEKRRL